MSRVAGGVVLLLVLAGACGTGPEAVREEDDRIVEPGTVVEAVLEGDGDRRSHPFIGLEGSHLVVLVEAKEPSWDTYLRVFDPTGALVDEDDDGGGGLNSQVRLETTMNGHYLAEVGGYNDNHHGPYTLSITLDRPQGRGEEIVSSTGEVTEGNSELSRFAFQGVARAHVTIAVNRDDEEFDPVVELFGPDGVSVGRDDDSGGDYNSLLEVDLPADGTYIAAVTGWADKMGTFRIRITMVPPAKGSLEADPRQS